MTQPSLTPHRDALERAIRAAWSQIEAVASSPDRSRLRASHETCAAIMRVVADLADANISHVDVFEGVGVGVAKAIRSYADTLADATGRDACHYERALTGIIALQLIEPPGKTYSEPVKRSPHGRA